MPNVINISGRDLVFGSKTVADREVFHLPSVDVREFAEAGLVREAYPADIVAAQTQAVAPEKASARPAPKATDKK